MECGFSYLHSFFYANFTIMKILVTGANGQLGKCLRDAAKAIHGVDFLFLGRDHFAIEQFGMVKQMLQELKPDWVINTAAYTAVDKAEMEQAYALLTNAEAVEHLAASCADVGVRLLHVSTDYVFDGNGHSPYKETDAVNPIGAYAQSKQLGEKLAMQVNKDVTIVRTSWVYSEHGNNFVKTMIRLMNEKESINVVDDQKGCPTYATDLAEALIKICMTKNWQPGIYHYCNAGVITWFEFAKAIAEAIGTSCQVNPIPTSAYPTLAKRPAYSALNTEKIQQAGIQVKPWRESLTRCLHQLGY